LKFLAEQVTSAVFSNMTTLPSLKSEQFWDKPQFDLCSWNKSFR